MKRWGLVVSTFYVIAVLILFGPVLQLLVSWGGGSAIGWDEAKDAMSDALSLGYFSSFGPLQLWFYLLIAGEALLLLLSVDTSRRRLKPRQSARLTALSAGLALALLTTAAIVSFIALYGGDEGPLGAFADHGWLYSVPLLWLFWGVVFCLYHRASIAPLDAALRWLLRGSVLELLVAVPSHVIVRQREECSAPAATGWGIVTGLAVMLMCFGPGVIALYRKRIAAYRDAAAAPRTVPRKPMEPGR